jgi:hypothetical protein
MKEWLEELCPELVAWQVEIIVEEVQKRINDEREACAKVCEEPGWNAANWCATQIRARGQA